MSELDQLFAGRTLALDRSALPSLARQAAIVLRGDAADVRAGLADSRNTRVPVQRVGSTAIVPLNGFITSDPLLAWVFGGCSPDALVSALREAVSDPDVRNVVLLINSPGGEVSLVPEAAAEIRRLRDIKPITAIARPLMASAAYWLGAQASTIVATPSALVGSCGVYVVHYDESELNARIGIKPTYVASDPNKVMGNPDAPLSDAAEADIQARVDALYGQFVADLAVGRRTSTAKVRATFGAGLVFGAEDGVKRGMVDGVMTLDRVMTNLSGTDGGGRSARALMGATALEAEQLVIEDGRREAEAAEAEWRRALERNELEEARAYANGGQ